MSTILHIIPYYYLHCGVSLMLFTSGIAGKPASFSSLLYMTYSLLLSKMISIPTTHVLHDICIRKMGSKPYDLSLAILKVMEQQ